MSRRPSQRAAMAHYVAARQAAMQRPRRRRIPLAVLAGCAVALLGAAWRAATGGAP